ncbi:MAG: hypothetical protein SNI36_02560 [Rikenellaceae bacterium]
MKKIFNSKFFVYFFSKKFKSTIFINLLLSKNYRLIRLRVVHKPAMEIGDKDRIVFLYIQQIGLLFLRKNLFLLLQRGIGAILRGLGWLSQGLAELRRGSKRQSISIAN